MIPSEELEITLALAEKGHDVKIPAKRVVEILRVYMAWAEAPEAIVTCATGSDVEAFGTNGSGNLKCRVRVKLVEVGDE